MDTAGAELFDGTRAIWQGEVGRRYSGEGIVTKSDLAPRLPNFLVIGAMKAGTTSLFHYLQAHPQVFMSPLKELDFFVAEANWTRGLGWYRKQFAGAGPDVTAIGEASTSYTKFPQYRGAPQRIRACLTAPRLIYVVRNPIDRIRSHYQHRVLAGSERQPLGEAVMRDPTYVDCSRYGFQLAQYLEYFSPEQILVITAEALREARASTISEVYSFIGVDSGFVPDILEQEFYRTEERARYPTYVWSLRRFVKKHFPVSKKAKEFVDSVLPRLLRRTPLAGKAPARSQFDMPDDVRRRLAAMLSADMHQLRAFMPEGFDGWLIA